MFKSTIKGDTIKVVVNALTALVEDGIVNLSEKGISIKTVDSANVAMISLSLNREAFESFEATEGIIGLDFNKLSSYLEMADKDDMVELALDEETHKLQMKIRDLTVTLSLLDPSSLRKEPKLPNLELPVQISVMGAHLKIGLKAAEKIADYITLSMKDTIFSMSASGDTDDMNYEFLADNLRVEKSANVSSLFALDYLIDIQKIAEKSEDVSIKLGKDYPTIIGFDIAEGHGRVEYMLAPRVESE